ncbi:MAG TPA: (2Fe-2S)-binding protein, partial [Nitrospiria bacterium]|nr:(2Fe-2S)-binding protein [Nitrospiria bacterium]
GLVAPILEQAKAAADSITGTGNRVFTGFVPSTRLKVAGINVTSMGDFNGKDEGSEELVYMDGGMSVYKKLVIRQNRVVGAIFLGDDTGSRQVQEIIQSKQDISAVRSTLLSGNGGEEETGSPADLPDTATICNCHSVTKAEITGAVCEKKCLTREQVSGTTKAGTGCGGCVPLMEELIDDLITKNPELGEGIPGGISARKRQGASSNKIEEIKKEKDGLEVWDDIVRYAAEGWEKITEEDIQRLKWYGLFLRVPTPGFFMLRVRIPNGIARSEQIRVLGEIAQWYGNGKLDITTRQQVQIRNIRIEDVPKVFQDLRFAGLSSIQTGMDSVRNVTGCPVTGLNPSELVESAEIVNTFNSGFLNNREFSNLPRKLNVAVTGCPDNCTHAESQDIALVPAAKEEDGVQLGGFNLLVGGKSGSGGFRGADDLDVFVRPEEASEVLKQVTLIFRDHGPRENRNRARL